MKSTTHFYMNKDLKNGLFVAGAALVLYILYTQFKKSKPKAGQYEVLEDFTSEWVINRPPFPVQIISFKKGEIIGAAPFEDGTLRTTSEKKIPDFKMVGEAWIIVQNDKVKLIS